MKLLLLGGMLLSTLAACQQMVEITGMSPKRPDKVVLTEAQWRKRLTSKQYEILRGHGTEAAFCGRFHDNHQKGTYVCAGCDLPLFASDAKFDSGTGWPSFYKPIKKDAVWERVDNSYGMRRVEVLCARCDGHLGHVFDDAPNTPTGLRYCLNSEAMKFVKKASTGSVNSAKTTGDTAIP